MTSNKVLLPVRPANSVQFAAVRIVHFRDVTNKECFVPSQAANEASQTLSAAIQQQLGRVPVLMTRFAPDADVGTDRQDWLLLTGPSVGMFLNDIGGVPDTETNSDGMWHFTWGG